MNKEQEKSKCCGVKGTRIFDRNGYIPLTCSKCGKEDYKPQPQTMEERFREFCLEKCTCIDDYKKRFRVDPNCTYCEIYEASLVENFIRSEITSAEQAMAKKLIKKMALLDYPYTNYVTQMSSKKNFEIGKVAKEIKEDALSIIKKYNNE